MSPTLALINLIPFFRRRWTGLAAFPSSSLVFVRSASLLARPGVTLLARDQSSVREHVLGRYHTDSYEFPVLTRWSHKKEVLSGGAVRRENRGEMSLLPTDDVQAFWTQRVRWWWLARRFLNPSFFCRLFLFALVCHHASGLVPF
jgi:hypothetical protein